MAGASRGQQPGGGDGGKRHGADGDVQHGRDGPDHQERGDSTGGEEAAQDVAEAGRGDGRGEGATHAGEDQDLSAFLEADGDGLLDALLADSGTG